MANKQTRLEKLDIPELSSRRKEEESEEEFGERLTRSVGDLEKRDNEVWKSLAKQTNLCSQSWEKAMKELEKWQKQTPVVQDMIINQKIEKVIDRFGNLLSSLDSEERFLMDRLKEYSRKVKGLERKYGGDKERYKEKAEEGLGEDDKNDKIMFKTKKERDKWIYREIRNGRSQADVARELGLTRSAINSVYHRKKEEAEELARRFEGKKGKEEKNQEKDNEKTENKAMLNENEQI